MPKSIRALLLCHTQIDDLLLEKYRSVKRPSSLLTKIMPTHQCPDIFRRRNAFVFRCLSFRAVLRHLQHFNHNLIVAGDEVGLDSKHLCGDGSGEGIDLTGVLLDLTAVDKGLES